MTRTPLLILGGGLAGLAAARFAPHDHLVLESGATAGGHLRSDRWAGAVWDQGPHVSFTKHKVVRELLSADLGSSLVEFYSVVENHDDGSWFPHPVQSHLYALPEQIRSAIASDFAQRPEALGTNYKDWLLSAYGTTLAERYMARYTRKYWTCAPEILGQDWVGHRLTRPDPAALAASLAGPPALNTHYVQGVRYPRSGGFERCMDGFLQSANVQSGTEVTGIDLDRMCVSTSRGLMAADRLVCAIPLPVFVKRCLQADDRTREAASRLRCTSLWLVDVVAPHPRRRGFHWAYVYDESMLSTRLTHMDALSAGNAPEGSCAIQVEVYESAYRALRLDADEIRRRVVGELGRMGLIDAGTTAVSRIRRIPWANVLFDQEQSGALERIWEWAERFGLVREPMDTHPLTDWAAATPLTSPLLAFAGRYAQWKYFWTDDCILRGMQLGGRSTAPAGP